MLAGAAGLAALPAGEAAAAAAPAPDLQSPEGRLKTYILMRGALDDQLVVGSLTGRYYGVVDAQITPLYGVEAATFARYRARPDGGFDALSYELAFFTDLKTGAVLDNFVNPYTGQTVTVPVTFMSPSPIIVRPDCSVVLPKAPPGAVTYDRIVSAETSGDDVLLTEESSAAIAMGPAKPFRYSEVLTLRVPAATLMRPGLKRAGCETAYTSVVSWRPWLQMGDRPGHLLGVGAGRYGASLDIASQAWRAGAAAHRPDVLASPGALLTNF